VVIKAEFNKLGGKGVQLSKFALKAKEWDILKQLLPILDVRLARFFTIISDCHVSQQIITYTTKQVSRSSTPLIHEVICYIDSSSNMICQSSTAFEGF
jgi:hypothetical protein